MTRKITTSLFFLFLMLVTAAISMACSDSSADAYDELRATAPAICKDYCEVKVVCERGATIGEDDYDAYTATWHGCVVACAALKAEGAYVYSEESTGERNYFRSVGGGTFMDGMACLADSAAFRCDDIDGQMSYVLSPPTQVHCAAALECMANMGINADLRWAANATGIGGECVYYGNEFLDLDLF